MPHFFRTSDGQQWKASQLLFLKLADGTKIEAIWAGSAQEEKLPWWLGRPGNELAQIEDVTEIAIKADDTGEIIWGAAPAGARLLFVVQTPEPGKNYRLAKMVTTAANPAQILCFRHNRFSLFGSLGPDGTIAKIPPPPPPPPPTPSPPAQGSLF